MIVTIVHVKVKPENVDDFIRATTKNHHLSVKEPGNLRFDVLQMEESPTDFALYEAYDDVSAAAAHKETAHYQEWRTAVGPWMTKPREGVKYHGIVPRLKGQM